MKVAVYDTKPYDQEYLSNAMGSAEMEWRFFDFRLSADTAATSEGCEAVCAFVNDELDRTCLEGLASKGVRLVALRCAGYNNVDLSAAKELGVAVVRVPAYSPHAVAEHTVGLLLALNRKIHRAYNRVREHNFSLAGLVGFDLFRKRVGIVGTGKIGKIAAQIFRGFDTEVLAYDPYPDPEWAKQYGVEYQATLAGVWRDAEIVSLHVPLLPENFHMINAKTLREMKGGAYLVNTSRGKLIDTAALIEVLKEGHLGGVALDVYEEEEGVFFEDYSDRVLHDDDLSRLLTFPNVLITSHQAFLTREALGEIARVTVTNIAQFSNGEPLVEGTVLNAI